LVVLRLTFASTRRSVEAVSVVSQCVARHKRRSPQQPSETVARVLPVLLLRPEALDATIAEVARRRCGSRRLL